MINSKGVKVILNQLRTLVDCAIRTNNVPLKSASSFVSVYNDLLSFLCYFPSLTNISSTALVADDSRTLLMNHINVSLY